MKNHDQKGLAPVAIILFVIIFAIIGFTGWYVMNQDKENKELSNQTINSSSNAPILNSKSTGDKFVFKELGVQFDLPSDLKGLLYKAEEITETNGEKGMALYLHLANDEIKSALKSCYGKDEPTEDGINFGAISRLEGSYKEPAEGPSDPLLKQFDTFYILGGYPNGTTSCSEAGVKENLIQNKVKELNSSFYDAFEKTGTKVN